MKIYIYRQLIRWLALFSCALLFGCSSTFEGMGNNLEHGLAQGVKSDSLTYNLMTGAREGLTSPESRRALDSLINSIGGTTSAQLQQLRDSLLGYQTQARVEALRESLLGQKTRDDLTALKNSLLDPGMQDYVAKMLQTLHDSSKVTGASLRDSLVGDRTNFLIKAIIDTAMTDLQTRLKTDVYPEMRGNISFVEANATLLIVIIGFIALVLCWFIWKQKEKYLRIAKLLTVQISKFPEEVPLQTLKKNISENAKTIGIEDDLRELLRRQGI